MRKRDDALLVALKAPITHIVILSNIGGELCRRYATSDEDAQKAAMMIVADTPYFSYGDTIRVVAYED